MARFNQDKTSIDAATIVFFGLGAVCLLHYIAAFLDWIFPNLHL